MDLDMRCKRRMIIRTRTSQTKITLTADKTERKTERDVGFEKEKDRKEIKRRVTISGDRFQGFVMLEWVRIRVVSYVDISMSKLSKSHILLLSWVNQCH